MDITLNYFELFQLPVTCELDDSQLALRYRELQKAVHPDRFVGDAGRQQRLSVQYAAYVNEAYTTLKSPLHRFIYMLKLAGRETDMEKNTVMDPAFLMEQMSLRESVQELRELADPEPALETLLHQVDKSLETYIATFSQLWSEGTPEDLDQAEAVVRKMQFMVKVSAELEQLEAELLD